jgi:hypothetical protein
MLCRQGSNSSVRPGPLAKFTHLLGVNRTCVLRVRDGGFSSVYTERNKLVSHAATRPIGNIMSVVQSNYNSALVAMNLGGNFQFSRKTDC